MNTKLAVVIWEDASFHQNFRGEITPENTYLIESISVGYLFRLKNEIGLIQTKQGEEMDVLFIPKRWVKRIVYLKEVKNEKRRKIGKAT